jgi:FkbM family methyltransferase
MAAVLSHKRMQVARSPLKDVEDMLSEGIADAKLREDGVLDEIAGGRHVPLVLFGAGRLGRRTLAAMRAVGRPVLAFADNDSSLWGESVDGVVVLSPVEAVRQHGKSALFVVTVWRAEGGHRYVDTRDGLKALGCRRIVSFEPLFWTYAAALLPHITVDLPSLVLADRENVRRAFSLFADERSQREFAGQLRWRLLGDHDALLEPVAGDQYLPDDVLALRQGEVFVDSGAYDGDTIRTVLRRCPRFRRIHAFEPDPGSYAALEALRDALPAETGARITLHQMATADHSCLAHFAANGDPASALQESGRLRVQCGLLDEVLSGESVSFIKMDVEGAEAATLRGSRALIERCRPVLAVAAYHAQSDLWRLPLLLSSLSSDYLLHLRPHQSEGFELVCYGVPRERTLA